MKNAGLILTMVGTLLLVACGGQGKTETTSDETTGSEHTVPAEHKMPEPPKVKADDRGPEGE
jgi:major membrane immunogen (membrane-anchored lipoprotein)